MTAFEPLPPLMPETIHQILDHQLSDAIVNALVWVCLGYEYDSTTQTWSAAKVADTWRQDYPEPPDFIGSRPATVKLTRSIPPEHKQLLKEQLGFKGYQVAELNPNLTRRATAANWLLSYMASQAAHSE